MGEKVLPKHYRLGLDLGTNSIGWTVLGLKESSKKFGKEEGFCEDYKEYDAVDDGSFEVESVVDMGVRIFSDGRNQKTKEPLNVERRNARQVRKNIYRKKLRRRALFRELQNQHLFPATKDECEKLKLIDPLQMRVDALERKLEPYELGRALFHLGVRRGFKSNRKDDKDSKIDESADNKFENKTADEQSKLKQGEKCAYLESVIKKSACRTLGEFLHKNLNKTFSGDDVDFVKNSIGARFTPNRMPFYPTRKLYSQEFEEIKKVQKEFYPNLNWDKIEEKIFFQRPLKSQERGKCQFVDAQSHAQSCSEYRAFKSLPSSNQFRILQEVNNLTYSYLGSKNEELPDELKKDFIKTLNEQKTLAFSKMQKIVADEYGLNSEEIIFNLDVNGREKLNGNEVECTFRGEKYFGKNWDNFSLNFKDEIVEVLILANEDSEVDKYLCDGIVPTFKNHFGLEDERLVDRCDFTEQERKEHFNYLTKEQRENIKRETNIVSSNGTTSLCAKLQQALVAIMGEKLIRYDEALNLLGVHHSKKATAREELLPYYGKVLQKSCVGGGREAKGTTNCDEAKFGKISNPTVHVALNQVRVVVNALIKKYGKPSQIVVELSRDLKNSKDKKDKISKLNKQNKDDNDKIQKEIFDAYNEEGKSFTRNVSREDRIKWKLWQELGENETTRKCPYCGKIIGATTVLTDEVEVEHILPYSQTLCDAFSNKTLSCKSCNAQKGNKTPYDAFSGDEKRWNAILQRVSNFSKVKRARFSQGAMERFKKESGFLNRQLTDNQYLSKAAKDYLKTVVEKDSNVWVIPGMLTSMIRDKLGLNRILNNDDNPQSKSIETIVQNLGTKADGKLEFEILKARKKKNREDHRHHAIDALVIGLTDRGLLQKISRANASAGDKMQNSAYRKKVLDVALPANEELCPATYSELLEIVKNIVVSHKPDHGAEGKLSKETLLAKIKHIKMVSARELCNDDKLGIKSAQDFEKIAEAKYREKIKELFYEATNGKQLEPKEFKKVFGTVVENFFAEIGKEQIGVYEIVFASRGELSDSSQKDLEKSIEEIIDDRIKEKLKKKLTEFNFSKYSSEKIGCAEFKKEVAEEKVGKGEKPLGKKFRMRNHDQKAISFKRKNKNPNYEAFYGTDDYFAAIIWEVIRGEKKSFEAEYIPRTQTQKIKIKGKEQVVPKSTREVKEGEKIVCTLYKGDVLELTSENGETYFAIVKRFSATNNKLAILPLYAVSDCFSWNWYTNDKVRIGDWGDKEGQLQKAVTVIFDDLKAQKVNISPIGDVKRNVK